MLKKDSLEIQIKTTMRYHLTLVRMATINKSKNNKCCKDMKKREPSYIVGGIANFTAAMEKSGRSSKN